MTASVDPADEASGQDRILVVKLYAIGDFIMSLPALGFLRARYPDSEIHLLTGNIIAPLASCVAPVDRAMGIPERILTVPISRIGLIPLILRLRKQRYSRAYLLHRVLPLRLLLLASDIPVRIGQGTSCIGLTSVSSFDSGIPEHDAERYGRLFGWDGATPLPSPRITLPASAVRRADTLLERTGAPVVAISPGGGRSSIRRLDNKRWPPDRFRSLIDRFAAEGIDTLLIGSRADREELGNLLTGLPGNSRDLVGKTTLTEAAALLASCSALITNDSALMHIAGLVSTPTLSLFGPTDPGRIGIYPSSPIHRTIAHEGMECSPCHPGKTIERCPVARCMTAIPVDRVWNEARALLEQKAAGGQS